MRSSARRSSTLRSCCGRMPRVEGIISVLELADMQDRPALFSTFMMWLLATLYETLPEIGDADRPKLVFFFDEAHLLFRDANKTFMQQVELVARLIRSKGVGVFFVTHAPSDVPSEVLGQLGNRVQHALRAFTPDDLEVVRATAETFPSTELYDVEEELTALGIGEALVTALDLKGRPMPTARTMMRPPRSLMAKVGPDVVQRVAAASTIAATYATDRTPIGEGDARRRLGVAPRRLPRSSRWTASRIRSHPAERKMRPTRAPERGVDWSDVANEGLARRAVGDVQHDHAQAILGVLTGGRRREPDVPRAGMTRAITLTSLAGPPLVDRSGRWPGRANRR